MPGDASAPRSAPPCITTCRLGEVVSDRRAVQFIVSLGLAQRLFYLEAVLLTRSKRYVKAVAEQDWPKIVRRMFDEDGEIKEPSENRVAQEAEDEEWWEERDGAVSGR
jgi:hypothetical protein